MPYLFTVEARYDGGNYILYNPSDLISNFPFLENKVIKGKIVSTYKDGKIIRVNKELNCKLLRSGTYFIGQISEPNPVKNAGLPLPSYLLIIASSYEEVVGQEKEILPIAENMLLKGGAISYFEDEIKRILKEEEAGIILEGTIFYEQLKKSASTLKEALLSFEQENFAHTKTSCRRVLEDIKQIVSGWKTVDGSESLSEKLRSVVGSLYSFASIGGPHEGVTTREETELILKNTTSLLFYINSLLRNQRTT